jgi:hypothetical protein
MRGGEQEEKAGERRRRFTLYTSANRFDPAGGRRWFLVNKATNPTHIEEQEEEEEGEEEERW